MKRFHYIGLLVFFLLAFFSIGITSCSDSDDEGGSTKGVLGTWIGNDGSDELKLTFKSGGKGVVVNTWYDYYSGEKEVETTNFTYTMEDDETGVIYIRYYDSYYGYENEVLPFMIDGKVMYLYDEYGSNYPEWVLYKQ